MNFSTSDAGSPTTVSAGSASPAAAERVSIRLAGLEFDRLTEAQVVHHIVEALAAGCGGWVATPNIDICGRLHRDPAARALLRGATLTVPDGMPLLWAARLRGDRIEERVTGSSLIFTLTSAAALSGRSIYLLGGAAGVPDLAGENLADRYPGLKVVGAAAPPIGFDATVEGIAAVREQLLLAAPDIVYVGLGFPKQEQLIAQLAPALPKTWFIACGAAIPFAAGTLARAPLWMQRLGMEWLFRLISEPRRLFHRYLIDDAPYAARLLVSSIAERSRTRRDYREIQLSADLILPPLARVRSAENYHLGDHGTDHGVIL